MSVLLLPGSAAPGDVLTGKKFSAGVNYGADGAMPENGAVIITPGPNAQAIPAGHHNGAGSVPGVVVPAANVKVGTTIAGTAGTMPDRQGIITPSGTAQWGNGDLAVYLPEGYYGPASPGNSELRVTVAQLQSADADLVAGNIRAGASLFGVPGSPNVVDTGDATLDAGANQLLAGYTAYARGTKFSGSMPNRGAPTFNPTTFAQGIAAGYYSGGQVNGDGNLAAGNIRSGVSIFGVAGNVTPKFFASGSITNSASQIGFTNSAGGNVNSYYITVSGLTFTPQIIIAWTSAYQSFCVYVSGINFGSGTASPIIFDSPSPYNSNFIQLIGNAYVNGTGFQLPVDQGPTINWQAYA